MAVFIDTFMIKSVSYATDPLALIPLADIKLHKNIEHDEDDSLLSDLAGAAIEHLEYETGRNFYDATYDETFECFPKSYCNNLCLSRNPVKAVSSITYYDTANAIQTWNSSNYIVHIPMKTNAFITVTPGQNWPLATWLRPDAVTVRYTTGYTTPPKAFKQACLLLIGAWYENREAESPVNNKQLEYGVQRLVNQLNGRTYR